MNTDAPHIARPNGEDPVSVRQWRRAMREVCVKTRLSIGSSQRQAARDDMLHTLTSRLNRHPPGILGLYWPIKGEPDLRDMAEWAIARGWKTALPVVRESRTPLEFHHWCPGDKLVPGVWKIPVPQRQKMVLPSVLLVPLVGFDENNYRLGYGGGYYDRTLAAMITRPFCIGVGLERCRLETIYPQWHDIPMDELVIAAD